MLNILKKYGVDLAGSIFSVDKGYDGERTFESLYDLCILPNIKLRKRRRRTNVKGKNRKKAVKIFNASVCHYRRLIGILGAEEARHHQLYCRFKLKKEQSEKIWIN